MCITHHQGKSYTHNLFLEEKVISITFVTREKVIRITCHRGKSYMHNLLLGKRLCA
jgi:hypothetical protein